MNLSIQQQKQQTPRTTRPITEEGALRLAEGILRETHDKYVRSLKIIMKARESNLTGPVANTAYQTKLECELFYKSRLFIICTLGKSIPGEEVIATIQEEVGFKE